jgi:hypothetical protein
MLEPYYLFHRLNEFIESISYDTLFMFIVSYDMYNVTWLPGQSERASVLPRAILLALAVDVVNIQKLLYVVQDSIHIYIVVLLYP